jgi:hypothetical protein
VPILIAVAAIHRHKHKCEWIQVHMSVGRLPTESPALFENNLQVDIGERTPAVSHQRHLVRFRCRTSSQQSVESKLDIAKVGLTFEKYIKTKMGFS